MERGKNNRRDYPRKKLPSQESFFLKNFNYDNTATNILELVVRSAVDMSLSEYFSRSFYKASGPIANGRWLKDKNDEEFAMGSFFAVPRDHLRVSIHILKIIQGEVGNDCIQSFAKHMIKNHVSTPTKPALYGTDSGYGYQIWTNLKDLTSDTVEMRGNAGQHVFLSPKTSTVILILTAADQRWDDRSMLNAKAATKLFIGK